MKRREVFKLLTALPFAAPAIVNACGQTEIKGIVIAVDFVINGEGKPIVHSQLIQCECSLTGSFNYRWDEVLYDAQL